MEAAVVQTEFDGVTRDGQKIVIRVAIGDLHRSTGDAGADDSVFYVEVEPLMTRRRSSGDDSLTAMCFGMELVRTALKIFVAHGGSVYFRGTLSPIDLENYWFSPVGGLLRPEFLLAETPPPEKPLDQAGR